jgi:hypothetical protein
MKWIQKIKEYGYKWRIRIHYVYKFGKFPGKIKLTEKKDIITIGDSDCYYNDKDRQMLDFESVEYQ